MKKRNVVFTLVVSGMVCFGFVACSDKRNEAEDQAKVETVDPHAGHLHAETTFEPGKGVELSEHGRAAVGLKTSDVKLGALDAGKQYTVQVYRRADEASVPTQNFRQGYAYASVLLPADEARKWQLDQQRNNTRLLQIDWQLENVTGQAEAIVEIHDPEVQHQIGDFLQVELAADPAGAQEVVSIPESAVLQTAKGTFAYAANQQYFFRTPIEVVGNSQGQALIAEGLFEGDVIASAGVQQLYQIELQVINGGQGCAHGH
jgi:multidrug efflux pump subunit AcrA (membrane-fusion protein)